MRILFVNHVPPRRELGAGRVQLELAEEIRRHGHEVDFFAPGAGVEPRTVSVGAIAVPSFAWYAQRHVRAVAGRYDVVEAHQGLLTASKSRLGFQGLLVVRSSGLVSFYRQADRAVTARLPAEARGRWAGGVLRAIEWRRSSLYTSRSFAAADLINVPNDDERRALERRRLAAKVVVLPNALPRSSLDALAAIADGPRPDPPRALVIGSWTYRKGIADWPAILARLWERIPAARVCFAGAGVPEAQVRADLGVGADPRVEVAPAYAPEELPALLAQATAGALASYVEGFGLGVLETLAAGRPCVSYDVPGPRDLAGAVNRGWLVPVGEAAALADRLADVLEHELAHPGETAAACVHFARRFGWDTVGAATVEAYERGLERLKRPGPRGPASPGRS